MDKQLKRKFRKKQKKKTRKILINKTLLLLTFYVSYTVYLIWRLKCTIPTTYGYFSLIAGFILFTAETVGFFESSIFYLTLWNTNTPQTPKVNGEFPDVDVFIATYNEPLDLLYKTIIGCKNMNYPDKNKVHIFICDDGNRKELENLCKNMQIGYITRTEHIHAKAGNLNNALQQTNSPYIITFDADMIPMHDFLLKTIPFFMTGEKIGFVQVPQNFYNADLFQYNLFTERNMPNEQDLFSKLLQAGKSRFNAIIYAGSNTVLSRKALDEIGGLVTGTITEDFATGMKMQNNGYKSICLNEVLANGLSPESIEDLYNQRIRWGRGVVQTFKAFNPLFMKGLNIIQKLMYFSAVSYWYFGIWRLIFFMAPILFSVFNIVVLSAPVMQILEIWLPMFVFTNITFIYFSKNVRTTSWSHIYDTILFPQITKGILKETFGLKMSNFKITPKENIKRMGFVNKFKLVRIQIIIAILSLIGIIKICYLYFTGNFLGEYIINLFWLIYNFYLLIMAIFFASERPKFRTNERIFASESVIINNCIGGKTNDISENGISIILKDPIYLDSNIEHNIKINTLRYTCEFSTELVRVDTYYNKYKYVFHITNINQDNFDKLLLILYDRVPLFPIKQKKSYIINNIIKNLSNRQKKFIALHRKLPRIIINNNVSIIANKQKRKIHILDYNYKYISVKCDKRDNLYDDFIIVFNNILLYCTLDTNLSRNKKGILIYEITNYNKYINKDIISLLKQ